MTDSIIPTRFLVRGGTAANLATVNETPRARELVYETDTGKAKLGDGSTAYNSLDYIGDGVWQPLAANLTQIGALADPNADRLLFWDDSAGEFKFLTLGTNLTITGTTIDAAGGGGGSVSAGAQIGYAVTTSTTAASTTDTSIPLDTTIPQSGEGVAYASLDTTYTVQEAASKLEVEVQIPLVYASSLGAPRFALFRDSGANAVAAAIAPSVDASHVAQFVMRCIVDAGSTGSTTFKLRWCSGAGTGYLMSVAGTQYFGSVHYASMTVREIKQ